MTAVLSPLTSGPTEKVRAVRVDSLIEAYRVQHEFDVSAFLPAIDEIEVHRCQDTGLEFFYPFNLEGPPAFYEGLYSRPSPERELQDKKWEFDVALRHLAGAQSVLDIGCGRGAFLERAREHVKSVAGLETNRFSREIAQQKLLEVHSETIAEHALHNKGRYDAATSFQVLEHIADPAAFIRAAIDVLRPGGLLLISVPNNDSFLKYCEMLPLNMPPHHVALWNRRALESLSRFFPLDLVAMEKEPLSASNLAWYQSTVEARRLPKSRLARALYYRLGGQAAFRKYLAAKRLTIEGQTILAGYRKRPAQEASSSTEDQEKRAATL